MVLKRKQEQQNEEQLSEEQLKKEKSVRKESFKFIYGNYSKYYGYRNHPNQSAFSDPRLECLRKKIDFAGKKCLDIGCNSGYLTVEIGIIITN
jgi:7SK snRNA methylphosphate capping enzyme